MEILAKCEWNLKTCELKILLQDINSEWQFYNVYQADQNQIIKDLNYIHTEVER